MGTKPPLPVNLTDAEASRAIFREATVTGTLLNDANVLGADFSGANLTAASLRDADTYNARFAGADLTGASLATPTRPGSTSPMPISPVPR